MTPIAPSPISAPAISPSTRNCSVTAPRPRFRRRRSREPRSSDRRANPAPGPHGGFCPERGRRPDRRALSAARAFCSTMTMVTPVCRIADSFEKTISTNFGDRPAEGSSSISTSGPNEHRARDRQHLPLPAGKPPGEQRLLPFEIGKRAIHHGDALGAKAARQRAGRELQIVVDGHRDEDVLGLRREGDPGLNHLMRGQARDVALAELDPAAADRGQTGDRLEKRRFACAVRTKHGDNLAFPRMDRGAVDDRQTRFIAGDQASRPKACGPVMPRRRDRRR